MMAIPHMLHLPEKLDMRLNRVAEASGETGESVLLDWLVNPPPELDTVDYNNFIKKLTSFTSIQLWTLLEKSLEDLKQVTSELSQLTQKSKQTDLSDAEQVKSDNLADLYDIYTLLRTEILVELRERGFDITVYMERNAPR